MIIGADARALQTRTPAGIGIYLEEIIDAVGRDRFLLYGNGDTPPQAYQEHPLTQADRRWQRPLLRRSLNTTLWESAWLPTATRRSPIDIFWGPRFFCPPFVKAPSVVTVHDLAFMHVPGVVTASQKRYFESRLRAAISRARHFIAISHFTRDSLCKTFRLPESRVTVIYNGFNARYSTSVDAQSKERVRQKYTLPDQFILFTGTIEPRKNLGRTVRAYLMSDARRERIPLVITGKPGWLQSGLEVEIRPFVESGDIVVVGYVSQDELAALYQMCLFFVLPSLYEGFAIPVLEAMASGTPVLTSNNTAMLELYEHAAQLVDPYSELDICSGINRMLDRDVRESLRAKGRLLVGRFSWHKSAAEHMQLFEHLLSRGPGR